MKTRMILAIYWLGAVVVALSSGDCRAHAVSPKAAPRQALRLISRDADPYGQPRPVRDARNVPLGTSIYFEIGPGNAVPAQHLVLDSVAVSLQARGGPVIDLLEPGWHFVGGASGWLRPAWNPRGANTRVEALNVYVEPGQKLKPSTTYTVCVSARSEASGGAGESGGSAGGELSEAEGTWSFTTEATPIVHQLHFPLDLAKPPVLWHGRFWSGFCNCVFCTDAATYGPTYELMAQARKQHPNAWSVQRDFWLVGTGGSLPNLVRQREMRRITKITPSGANALLTVGDFFGHEQYGIPSGRKVSEDYHPGDEVLISTVHAHVLGVDDHAGTVLVSPITPPPAGWGIEYRIPVPTKENPDAPGLFPYGGCYLRKFKPEGTACFYWGRLDKEWDLAHRRYGRRLQPNFTTAPMDLAADGMEWTTAEDYAQWHEVVRAIAGHVIDRYGADALQFEWSVFNEPNWEQYWRCKDWVELQKFYDYTADGILRAFEDRGYDSQRVLVGGLELGGPLRDKARLALLKEFLTHCSPTATAEGALSQNAAFADPRLDGQRSKRVELLCRAHHGKGSPCDFISVHSYTGAETMAAKLFQVKQTALAIDPEFYKNLWADSHESCPDYQPPPDEAAGDSYRGDGYFPSWCVDVEDRQLRQAARDPRYAFGLTMLTTLGPTQGLTGVNSFTRILGADDHGNGHADREVTIAYPVFHALNLLSDLGDRYWILPLKLLGGDRVSGFASRDDQGTIRVVLSAHNSQDTQSRSNAAFDVTLDLNHLGWEGPAHVEEYRFDRQHNSYYQEIEALVGRNRDTGSAIAGGDPTQVAAITADSRPEPDRAQMEQAIRSLQSLNVTMERQGLKTLNALDISDLQRPEFLERGLAALSALIESTKDKAIHDDAQRLVWEVFHWDAYTRSIYPAKEVERLEQLSQCRPTATSTRERQPDGRLQLTAQVASNGLNFLVIRPASRP